MKTNNEITDLLARDELEAVFETLMSRLEQQPQKKKELLLIMAQYSEARKAWKNNTLNDQDYSVAINKIRIRLLDLIDLEIQCRLCPEGHTDPGVPTKTRCKSDE